MSGLLTRTTVHFHNLYTETHRNYSLTYRLLLTCLIGLAFLSGQYFAARLLSFLLHEPSFQYRTFDEISQHAPSSVKILWWSNSGAEIIFKQTGSHYEALVSRVERVDDQNQLVSEANVVKTARGEQILILNERQLDRTLARYSRFLDIHPGVERVGTFCRSTAIRRGAANGQLIDSTIQLMLEGGIIEAEEQREQYLAAKKSQMKIHSSLINDIKPPMNRIESQMTVRSIRVTDLIGPLLGLAIVLQVGVLSSVCRLIFYKNKKHNLKKPSL